MGELERLIQELCPNGVKYKKLGDLCSLITKQTGFDYTNHIKNKLITEETVDSVPYIQTKFFTGKTFDYHTDYYVPYEVVKQFPKITLDSKCLLFSIVGASIGNVGLFPNDRTCFLGGAICVAKVKEEYNVDYLYYCSESSYIQQQIRKKTKGAGQATITVEDVREFSVPLPPIEIQCEIVRILDNLTELTAELTVVISAEREARKQQYEYYRDNLLTFDGMNIPLLELRNVVKKSCSGSTPTKGNLEYYTNGTIPWIRTQDVRFNEITEVNSYITDKAVAETAVKWIPENCVIVAISGATAGRCAINKIKATTNQHCLNLEIDDTKALYKYIYYCIYSKYEELVSRKQGARGDLNSSLVLSLKIPIPSLDEQQRIVNVLEQFESLCNGISAHLSAEIVARQKQYEYYRDKLLTFEEKKS